MAIMGRMELFIHGSYRPLQGFHLADGTSVASRIVLGYIKYRRVVNHRPSGVDGPFTGPPSIIKVL